MNEADFQLAATFSLASEGGYSNVAGDKGGSTEMGITQAAYDQYTGRTAATHPVTEITKDMAEEFYRTTVWLASHCDELSTAMGIVHFDWAVNHGASGACRSLQTCLGLTADGIIGPATLAVITAKPDADMVAEYLAYRRTWYKKDVVNDVSQAKFLTGWLARVDRLAAYVQPYIK